MAVSRGAKARGLGLLRETRAGRGKQALPSCGSPEDRWAGDRLRPSPLSWETGANPLRPGGGSPCRGSYRSLAGAELVVRHPTKALTSWRT